MPARRRSTPACPGSATSSAACSTALNGDPTAECVITTGTQGFFEDCLILADDFRQYYLGAFTRIGLRRARRASTGIARADRRATRRRCGGAPTQPARRGRASSSRPARCCRPTSSRSSPARARRSTRFSGQPVRPDRGRRATPGPCTRTTSYMRLTKTIDLSPVTAAQTPQLQFQLSLEHRAVLRPRDRRGAHRRPGQLDDAARASTAARRPRRRPSAPTRASCSRCTRSCATTSAARDCTAPGTTGHLELVHRLDRRLAARSRSTCRPTPASRSRSRSPT